jgi:hypothetical protein
MRTARKKRSALVAETALSKDHQTDASIGGDASGDDAETFDNTKSTLNRLAQTWEDRRCSLSVIALIGGSLAFARSSEADLADRECAANPKLHLPAPGRLT